MHHVDQSHHLQFPVALADLGGTNLRVGWIESPNDTWSLLGKVRVRDHDNLDAAMAALLSKDGRTPATAIVAFAGPVGVPGMRLTNHKWDIEPDRLCRSLDLREVILVNDFAAQALALPGLGADDLRQIGGGIPKNGAAKLVIGPGTGLGVAGLVPSACGWIPVAGEAGHIDLAAQSDLGEEIWRQLSAHGRVSAETIVSGPGLARLHRAVCATSGTEIEDMKPEQVTADADGGDRLATETMNHFACAFGRAAGDLALVFMAQGGVYLSGGIAPRVIRYLNGGGFREAFEDKAPHEAIMRGIPVYVVTAPEPALDGLAALATTPDQFGIDLEPSRFRA